ncbi:nuclear mRNA export, poly(A)+RNA binding protein [Mycoemilia scoparia]|uniref:Nuclear mRNA export, poly(A)+RNA binding protein n=1 Tax=Mycoemilia scoparia TaxID=417184 RepID=A0A9W8DT65_9FUNG|nr:nuclear mRNA export, poly(A)+RNA binding protein [Mycoemilia scoparia]
MPPSKNKRGGRGKGRARSGAVVGSTTDARDTTVDAKEVTMEGISRTGVSIPARSGPYSGKINRPGRGRGSRRNRNTRDGSKHQSSSSNIPITLSVSGFSYANKDAFIGFVNVSTMGKVKILGISFDKNLAYVTVQNKSQADAMLRLDNNSFSGKKLSVRLPKKPITAAPTSSQKPKPSKKAGPDPMIKDTLVRFIKNNIDGQGTMLKLVNLENSQDLREVIAGPKTNETLSKLITAILTLASKMHPKVITIDLSDNNIQNTKTIGKIGELFPRIENISFKNNALSSISDFSCISTVRSESPLKYLKIIALDQNPVLDNCPDKRAYGKLPYHLKYVDRSREVAQPSRPDVMIVSCDESDIMLCQNFLKSYFERHDGNRNELLPFYHGDAVFSTVAIPNASSIGTNKDVRSDIFFSSAQISNKLLSMPPSKHDPASLDETQFKCFQIEPMSPATRTLLIQHDCKMLDSTTNQVFDARYTFIIGLIPNNSRQVLDGSL